MNTGRVERGGTNETALSSAEIFRRVDDNGDGFLEWHEFVEALKMMRPNLSPSDIRKWWESADGHRTGRCENTCH